MHFGQNVKADDGCDDEGARLIFSVPCILQACLCMGIEERRKFDMLPLFDAICEPY